MKIACAVPVTGTTCGEFGPEFAIEILPLKTPVAVGLKPIVRLHEAAGPRNLVHLFVWEKGLETEKPRSFTVDWLVFVSVTIPEAGVPFTSAYKLSGIGDADKSDTISPVPLRLTVCAPPGPSPDAVRVPVAFSFVDGI